MSCRQQDVQSVELGYVIICKKWQVVVVVVVVAVVVAVTDSLSL